MDGEADKKQGEKSTTDVDSSVEEDSEGEEIDSTTDEQDEAGLESTTNEDNDSDQIDEAESESANSELEYEEYKYEQDNINVFVNGYANISSGIYYTDDSETETSNVVRAYVDLNIEEVLFDMFKSILSGPFEHETIYLDFDNNGLELIEE